MGKKLCTPGEPGRSIMTHQQKQPSGVALASLHITSAQFCLFENKTAKKSTLKREAKNLH
jgi:hypothetical protein